MFKIFKNINAKKPQNTLFTRLLSINKVGKSA